MSPSSYQAQVFPISPSLITNVMDDVTIHLSFMFESVFSLGIIVFFHHDSICQKWHGDVFLYAFGLSFIIISPILSKEAIMIPFVKSGMMMFYFMLLVCLLSLLVIFCQKRQWCCLFLIIRFVFKTSIYMCDFVMFWHEHFYEESARAFLS